MSPPPTADYSPLWSSEKEDPEEEGEDEDKDDADADAKDDDFDSNDDSGSNFASPPPKRARRLSSL